LNTLPAVAYAARRGGAVEGVSDEYETGTNRLPREPIFGFLRVVRGLL
jgi:hypothetical protein